MFLSLLLGVVGQMLIAYYFGAGGRTDSYFMARTTSDMLGKLMLISQTGLVFVPIFLRIRGANEAEGWRFFNQLLMLVLIYAVVIAAAVIIFAEPIVRIVASGFDVQQQEDTVRLFRMLFPAIIINDLILVMFAALQALKRFAEQSLARVVGAIVIIPTLTLLAIPLGISALVVSVWIAALLQIGILMFVFARQKANIRVTFRFWNEQTKEVLRLLAPFVLGVIFVQIHGVVYKIYASHLVAGSFSALFYATRFLSLFTAIFSTSVSKVLYPTTAILANIKDYEGLKRSLAKGVRAVIVIFTPVSVILFLFNIPLTQLLLQRGQFTSENTALVAFALGILAISIVPTTLYGLLSQSLVALEKTKSLTIVTIISQFVHIGLYALLVPRLGYAGLVYGPTIAVFSTLTVTLLFLRHHIGQLGVLVHWPTIMKVVATSGVVFSLALILHHSMIRAEIHLLWSLIFTIGTGGVLYFIILRLLGVAEVVELEKWLRSSLLSKSDDE